MSKIAFLTGVTGQTGSYLAELLLEKGYEVHGMMRRSSNFNTQRIDHIFKDLHLHYGDLTDSLSVMRLVDKIKPEEIYNLGAMSHVAVSFETPEYCAQVDALGPLRLLEAIRSCNNWIKFYQASTSELYGKVQAIPQSEETPFYPRSPYGVAKLYAYWLTKNYREAYDIFACNGILFNHESPRRGATFVTRKITRACASIKLGLQDCLELGNLNAMRDWGYAKEYAEAIYLMLQQSAPEDFVIASGRMNSVREFCEMAFKVVGIDLVWSGSGQKEIGKNRSTGKTLVKVNPRYFRPAEVETLVGDPTKAREVLGWESKTRLEKLCEMMVLSDLADLKK